VNTEAPAEAGVQAEARATWLRYRAIPSLTVGARLGDLLRLGWWVVVGVGAAVLFG